MGCEPKPCNCTIPQGALEELELELAGQSQELLDAYASIKVKEQQVRKALACTQQNQFPTIDTEIMALSTGR